MVPTSMLITELTASLFSDHDNVFGVCGKKISRKIKRNREIARLWIWQILKTVFSVKDVILSYLSGNINCLEIQYCIQFAGSYEGLKNWRASAVIEGHLMEKVSLLFHSKSATGLFYCTFTVSIVWYFESVKERRRSCFYEFWKGFLDAGFVKPSDEQI